MRFDLVLCDVDGCLSPEHPGPLDVNALAAVAAHNRAARERRDRPRVVLCTGRPQPFAELLCRLIEDFDGPAICENGVWLYHPANNRYELDPTITPAQIAAIQELAGWMRERYGAHGAQIQPGKDASASLYHGDHEWLVGARAEIAAEAARRGLPIRVSMSWFYVNCDLAHVSKGSGIQRLAAATGIGRDRSAGIGDTLGDLAIADNVAWFACPANADPKLKARAHYVSPLAEAAGVVDILEQIGRLA